MIWVLASAVFTATALPRYLHLERSEPALAIAICLSALIVRALSAVLVVIIIFFYLPATTLYAAMTQWCWHAILPVLADHVGVNGHQMGDFATPLPLVAVSVSVISMICGVGLAAYRLRRWLDRKSLGRGPCGSTIVPGSELMLATAGLARSQVVVSTGALAALDDAELAAGVEHERGHIVRGHRLVFFVSAICTSIARFLPGTTTAAGQLAFHLERDADAYALARCHDRLVLASAICKAALFSGEREAAIPLQGRGSVTARLRLLMESPSVTPPRRRTATRAVALALVGLVLTLSAGVSIAAAHGPQHLELAPRSPHCEG